MKPDPVSLTQVEFAVRAVVARCVMRDGTTADETLIVLNKREVEMLRRAGRVLMHVAGHEESFRRMITGKKK